MIDWLMIIGIATIFTGIVQCIEMYLLIQSTKRTNYIFEHPIEIVSKLAEDLEHDKKAQETFFSLTASMAATGFQQIQSMIGKDIKKDIASAANPLPKKYAWAWPFVQGFLPKAKDQAIDAVVEQML
jgi:hypothetical protein